MTDKIIQTKNELETAAIAAQIMSEALDNKIVFLQGDLGTGKTVFARSLIRCLAQNNVLEVPSPTFSLLQTYNSDYGEIWHYDLYRLKAPDEVYQLGWEEAIHEHITIIEWPERLGSLKPAEYLDIHISNVKDKPSERQIRIRNIK